MNKFGNDMKYLCIPVVCKTGNISLVRVFGAKIIKVIIGKYQYY